MVGLYSFVRLNPAHCVFQESFKLSWEALTIPTWKLQLHYKELLNLVPSEHEQEISYSSIFKGPI